ncbi:hypothetical protein E2C01_007340 [Portunus trituberculatus]|uniref:Uncharacterized protein n=1 Tax=Portunus trituberculatus TaxID=210409 RepID=A0A5B7CXX7_PORTR|nr:hypothetical protein [Portunus trituberculatus]
MSCSNTAAIDCFQCKSTEERTCGEELPQHHTLFADSCDHIQEAEYCVKMTGLVEGGAPTLFHLQPSCLAVNAVHHLGCDATASFAFLHFTNHYYSHSLARQHLVDRRQVLAWWWGHITNPCT